MRQFRSIITKEQNRYCFLPSHHCYPSLLVYYQMETRPEPSWYVNACAHARRHLFLRDHFPSKRMNSPVTATRSPCLTGCFLSCGNEEYRLGALSKKTEKGSPTLSFYIEQKIHVAKQDVINLASVRGASSWELVS